MHWLRRVFLAGLLAAFGIVLYGRFVRDRSAPPDTAAQWPLLKAPGAATSSAMRSSASVEEDATVDEVPSPIHTLAEAPPVLTEVPEIHVGRPPAAGETWVLPLADGGCPDGHPVKANDNSGIYHVPDGRFYARTHAERCYALAGDAEADGYRRAKA